MKIVTSLFLVGFVIFPNVGGMDFSFLSLLIGFVFCVIKYGHKCSLVVFSKEVIYFVLIFIFLWALTIILFFIHGGYAIDPQFMFKPPRVVLILFLMSVIIQVSQITMIEIFKIILLSATINAVVIYLQYIFHMTGVTDSFLLNPNTGENALTPYRKPGLMAGYPISGMLSFIGSLISIYLYYFKRKIHFLLLFFIVGFTCFITSRTSMYMFIFFGMLYYLYLMLKMNKIFYVIVPATVIFLLFGYLSATDNEFFSGTINKMFANVNNYIESGSFHDNSTSDLMENHYQLPSDDKTMLLGTSLPNDLSPVNSDVSIFRITWYSGVFTTLLYIALYFYLFIGTFVKMDTRTEKTLIIFIFIAMSIANMKGSYLFSRVLGDCLLMIWLAVQNNFIKIKD
ncbi:hypothetical protein [Moritella sp.]|uniref:hypothetical protein n=1 Tax=Moritella sp. TaxID=78556 RepID=UPI001D38CD77|nr:hypothetical protein [Moritella sp.]MCJ8347947.1 hypothetical protein [Moritella sp.]NQZ40380.1 hypothetical protein [Moritella sp.]